MISGRPRFTGLQRLLHWLMALCVLAMLFIGVGMVSVVTPNNLTLVRIHKCLGLVVLLLALFRLGVRLVKGAPALPPDLPAPLRFAAESSQYLFYVLMIGMPLLGWGMLSASSHPVIIFGGLHLPPILPVNAQLYSFLRFAHHYLGFAFFALILGHVAGILFHKLIRNDGIFETMASVQPTESPDTRKPEQ